MYPVEVVAGLGKSLARVWRLVTGQRFHQLGCVGSTEWHALDLIMGRVEKVEAIARTEQVLIGRTPVIIVDRFQGLLGAAAGRHALEDSKGVEFIAKAIAGPIDQPLAYRPFLKCVSDDGNRRIRQAQRPRHTMVTAAS